MSKFGKYVGKLELVVDEEELSLDFRMADKIELIEINTNKKDVYSKTLTLVSKILKRSYPEDTDEERESFLTKKFDKLLEELMISLELTTRAELEKAKKKLEGDFQKAEESLQKSNSA